MQRRVPAAGESDDFLRRRQVRCRAEQAVQSGYHRRRRLVHRRRQGQHLIRADRRRLQRDHAGHVDGEITARGELDERNGAAIQRAHAQNLGLGQPDEAGQMPRIPGGANPAAARQHVKPAGSQFGQGVTLAITHCLYRIRGSAGQSRWHGIRRIREDASDHRSRVPGCDLERAKGFEPSTPTLARSCSTPELRPPAPWTGV